MIRFDVNRDAAGQPTAIRVRVDGAGLRRLAHDVWRRVPKLAAARQLTRPARAIARGVRAAVPNVDLRRDAEGRPAALVLRFGARAPAAEPHGEPISMRARRMWRSSMAVVSDRVPRASVQRDEQGRPAAIRLRIGAPAVVSSRAPVLDDRPQPWVIEPTGSGLVARLQEFWRYRRIAMFFGGRTLSRMYSGTVLGKIWMLRPIIPIAIGALVFGQMLGVPSDGVPYFLFYLSGSAIWMLFEQSMLQVTRSLDANKGLVKKVYFPRLVIPVAAVAPAVLYFGIFAFLLLVAFVRQYLLDHRWYMVIGPRLLFSALACVLAVLLAVSVGLWTSVWQVRAREVRYGLRYFMRFWNYLTPVIYPISQIPAGYRWLLYFNPMAAYVETFKWGLLGTGEFNATGMLSAIGMTAAIMGGGIWYFHREEGSSIDAM